MRKALIEYAAAMTGRDPEELTLSRAMAIIRMLSINDGEFAIHKADRKDGKNNG